MCFHFPAESLSRMTVAVARRCGRVHRHDALDRMWLFWMNGSYTRYWHLEPASEARGPPPPLMSPAAAPLASKPPATTKLASAQRLLASQQSRLQGTERISTPSSI